MGACQQNRTLSPSGDGDVSWESLGRLDSAVLGRVFWYNMQEDFYFVSGCQWVFVSMSHGSDFSKQVWGNALKLHDKKGFLFVFFCKNLLAVHFLFNFFPLCSSFCAQLICCY